ncbi:MAG: hypothetical protein KAR57_07355 [Bacteroidales bacterium]|nr:hypothetical protein [Bacteroidales bacterium]
MENKEILKVIEDVSEILSIMIELKNSGRFREALEKIDDTLLKYFDCEKDFIYSVSEDFLINALKQKKGLNSEQLASLAELLSEKGDILLEQNNLKDSRKVLKNTLKIYYFLNEDQDFFSFKNMNKMVLINDKLSGINLKIQS